jgi:hypothetical protein
MIAVNMEIHELIEMVFCVGSGLPSCVAKITTRAMRQDTATMQLRTSKTQRSSHWSRIFLHLWKRDTVTRVLSDSLDVVVVAVTPAIFSLSGSSELVRGELLATISGVSELVRGEILTAISGPTRIVSTSLTFYENFFCLKMLNR